MRFKKLQPKTEKRRYRRLDHICPVEFQCLNPHRSFISGWYQAFTQDVSDGGMCLTVNHVHPKDLDCFQESDSQLVLHIHVPAAAGGLRATARVAWLKKIKGAPESQYVLGVAYEDIEPKVRLRISRYCLQRQYFRVAATLFTVFLAAGLLVEGARNIQLRYENLALLKNFIDTRQTQLELSGRRRLLEFQAQETDFLLSQANRKIERLSQELASVAEGGQKAVADLRNSIAFLKKYQEGLRRNLGDLAEKRTALDAAVARKTRESSLLEGKMLDKLYHWLLAHQNKATGLVTSYEGDSDIQDWAFTYDQALAIITFVANGDADNARKILDFYARAPKSAAGAFVNAYDAATGEIVEYTTHVGPNIWLGLAALQYTHRTGDGRYMDLAHRVAVWLATIRDSEGGLRGGKEFSWYSTEHNLDAFAFYRMLYQISGQESYQAQAQKTLEWLKQNAYSALSQPVVKRGKGDATIATDTYAWSLTAVGPRRLAAIGMDPDGIIDFALEHCSVSVTYRRPDGTTLDVRGFDFAKAQHLARGGVISCEWSAQMIMALGIMVDYHRQQGNEAKASAYGRMADDYASELSKMIITSDSAVGQGDFCLPYASAEMADTGHGWRTPKGNKTGSVAATAYAILAIKGYNPLVISE
ncbi:MAG: PilZ domain-containing protein [Candidatus Omnitrophota bacterium]